VSSLGIGNTVITPTCTLLRLIQTTAWCGFMSLIMSSFCLACDCQSYQLCRLS